MPKALLVILGVLVGVFRKQFLEPFISKVTDDVLATNDTSSPSANSTLVCGDQSVLGPVTIKLSNLDKDVEIDGTKPLTVTDYRDVMANRIDGITFYKPSKISTTYSPGAITPSNKLKEWQVLSFPMPMVGNFGETRYLNSQKLVRHNLAAPHHSTFNKNIVKPHDRKIDPSSLYGVKITSSEYDHIIAPVFPNRQFPIDYNGQHLDSWPKSTRLLKTVLVYGNSQTGNIALVDLLVIHDGMEMILHDVVVYEEFNSGLIYIMYDFNVTMEIYRDVNLTSDPHYQIHRSYSNFKKPIFTVGAQFSNDNVAFGQNGMPYLTPSAELDPLYNSAWIASSYNDFHSFPITAEEA